MKDERKVMAYWCGCGESIQCVSTLEHYQNNKSTKREYNDAKRWGRRVEEMTMDEYRTHKFMDCKCFNND